MWGAAISVVRASIKSTGPDGPVACLDGMAWPSLPGAGRRQPIPSHETRHWTLFAGFVRPCWRAFAGGGCFLAG